MTKKNTTEQKTGRRSSMRTRQRDPGTRLMNQMRALAKGKEVVFTIENPSTTQTNKRFIKVRVSPRARASA